MLERWVTLLLLSVVMPQWIKEENRMSVKEIKEFIIENYMNEE